MEPTAPNTAGAQPSTEAYVDSLAPPVGTMFWKRLEDTIADNVTFSWKSTTLTIGTWRVDVYVYVSGAFLDDPQFAAKGGLITVVIVHQGLWTAHVPQNADGLGNGDILYHAIVCPKRVVEKEQRPPNDGGNQNGNDWRYSIDYDQTLPMFRNGATEVFDFHAVYQKDFSLHETKQDGTETSDGLKFSMTLQKSLPSGTEFPINGLSVFKFDDPKAFPMDFEFQMSVYVWSSIVSKKVRVDLDFA